MVAGSALRIQQTLTKPHLNQLPDTSSNSKDNLTMTIPDKPPLYKDSLGTIQILEADSNGIVPCSHAWPLTAYLEPNDFETLRSLFPMAHDGCQWFVIAYQLSPEELATLCGPVTAIRLGPNQAFLSITFGQNTFNAKYLADFATQLASVRPDLASNQPRKLTKTGNPTSRPPARTSGLARHHQRPKRRR